MPPLSVVSSRLPVSVRFALRELRGGLGGFRIFLACLALGVFAIAAAGSLNAAMKAGLRADAQALLGGDLDLRLQSRPPTAAERATLEGLGTGAITLELRTMVRPVDPPRPPTSLPTPDQPPADAVGPVLVEAKGVPPGYPLYGAVTLTNGLDLATALGPQPGETQTGETQTGETQTGEPRPGAVIAPALATRLGLAIGDRLRLGDLEVVVTGLIAREPDDIAGAFRFGPRLMVSADTLRRSGLIQPGSLVQYHLLLRLSPGVTEAEARTRLETAHPEAGWRIRGTDEAGAGLQRMLDRLTLFLVLVGLSALLVGGLGVANAAHAHLLGRLRTIATLKCLGAPAALIHRLYLVQMGVIAVAGTLVGLAAGALTPLVAAGFAGSLVPVPLRPGLYPAPLALAGAVGLLVALIFSLWPLARARAIPATALFRGAVGLGSVSGPSSSSSSSSHPAWAGLRGMGGDLAVIAGASLLLAGLVILASPARAVTAWFLCGAVLALLLFRAAAWGVTAMARRLPVPRGRPALRLALANLHRPGAATTSVVLSLGLGLSVLVALALVEGTMTRHIARDLPKAAPKAFFLDIQPDQVEPLAALVAATAPEADLHLADMIRGRIRALNGQPIDAVAIDPDVRWAVEGDRGFTTAATLPAGSTLAAGTWWPADYQGPPQFSLTRDLMEGFGLVPGQTVTVNILGRDITGPVVNAREVDWSSLRMNFAFVASPGAFAGAPRTWIATLTTDAATARAVERAVTARFANVSVIDVGAALDRVTAVLTGAAAAVRAAAAVTVASGLLVLAGAFAATHQRRLREAVTLKVLGATRGLILRSYTLEYGGLGLVTGLVAALVGSLAAWAITTFALDLAWIALPEVLGVTLVACVVLTLAGGFLGTWRALGQAPAPLLRGS